MSDGVPTPTIKWYKPDGSEINRVKSTENTVPVRMGVDQDFGDYKCNATNGLPPSDERMITIKQISKLNSSFLAISSYDKVAVLHATFFLAIEKTPIRKPYSVVRNGCIHEYFPTIIAASKFPAESQTSGV